MRSHALVLFAAVFALLAGPAPRALALRALGPGDPVSPVEVSDEALRLWPLPELLGPKGALVVFWASWNPRSPEILAYVKELDQRYRDEGLRVVALNAEHEGLREEEVEDLARSYARWGLGWPTYFDPRLDAFAALGVITFPTSVYVGPDRRISGLYPGFPAEAREALEELVQKGLGVWRPAVTPRRAEPVRYLPKNGAAEHLRMAGLLLARGQRRRAAGQARASAERDPDYALAYAVAAYLSDAADSAAEAELKPLRDRAGEEPAFREALGVALVGLDRLEEARRVLEPLLALDEPWPRGLVALAFLRHRAADPGGAREVLDRLRSWPLGGVPLEVDASEYVDDHLPLEEQWKDPQAAAMRLLGLGAGR